MKRNLTYKLAILGCVSSCLLSVANAHAGDERVIFESPLPVVTDVACNADPRHYFYTVFNDSDDEMIEIEDYFIIIEDNDDFPEATDIVKVDQSLVSLSKGSVPCKIDLPVPAGKSCVIGVNVTPSDVPCPVEHPFFNDREIERALKIELDAGSQVELVTPIDFDVTILGTAGDYALLGDVIFIGCDDCITTQSGIVQVAENVGYALEIDDADDILFHDDAVLIDGLVDPDTLRDTENVAAFSDAAAAYDALKGAAYDNTGDCHSQMIEISGNINVTAGVYCLSDEDRDNDYFVVDGRITFQGNKDSLFVFVMPARTDGDEVDFVEFEVEQSASYLLQTVSGEVDPNNIFWLGADSMEFDTGSSMVGTFMTNGSIFADEDLTLSEPVGPATIRGKLIGLQQCDPDDLEACIDPSFIVLNGNTIVEP